MPRHVHILTAAAAATIVVAGLGSFESPGPITVAQVRAAEPADLDASFGEGGKVITTLGGQGLVDAIAIQPDGAIVAAGAADSRWTLARYTANGALDPSFDGDGIAMTEVGGWSGDVRGVALQGDGKIVAAGSTSFNGGYCCRLAIVRYNADGSLDSSFDGDGKLVSEIAFYAAGVAIQEDGRIVVAGTWDGWPKRGFMIARFNSDGTPDASFDTDGVSEASFGSLEAISGGMALAPDGRIVVVGSYGSTFGGETVDIAVARLNVDGSLDTTFGGDGTVTTKLGGTEARARAVVVDPDGRIVVAGSRLLRYNTDGSLDSGFGDGGAANIPGAYWGYGLALQPDGRVLVAWGGYVGSDDPDFAVGRFDPDGELDALSTTDFGEAGTRTMDVAHAVAIQADGKVVAAGSGGSWSTNQKWALARYNALRPNLRLLPEPTAVGFGSVMVGASVTSSITFTNPSSSTSVAIDRVDLITGPGSGLAVTSQGCPIGALAPKGSCVVEITFTPGAGGDVEGRLEVGSNATPSTLVVPATGSGVLPPSGVAWGTTYAAGPSYTWNSGNVLGRTVQSGTQRLHLVYATNRIGSRWARDTGPYMGIYYVRSTGGTAWSTPKRLNPSTQHAERPGLAAAGSRVYATWVSQTKLVRYSATAPRVLYVRVNTNHGTSTSWKSPVRLTSTSGRVDYPTIAASGYDVHVAWTNSATGSVKVATSRDRGATWKTTSLGTASYATSSGRMGYPSVAVSGSMVAVTWLADKYGTIRARVSTNRGASWGSTVTLATGTKGITSVAVRGNRIAVAWTTADEVVLRQRVAGTWGEPVVVAALDPGAASFPYAPAVVLQDPARIGVAWAESASGLDGTLSWAESSSDGVAWYATQTVAARTGCSSDWPSIVWPSATTRYVVWNRDCEAGSYRLYLRKGTGAPVGPTSVAPTWVPAAESPAIVPLDVGAAGSSVTPDGRREAPLLRR